MDIEWFNDLQADRPKFNQDIIDGIAYKELKKAEDRVVNVIHCAEPSFPDKFEFLGASVCGPRETFQVIAGGLTKSNRMPPTVDLAITDAKLVKFQFAFDDRELYPRYFYVPYSRLGGFMGIAGNQFLISAVLADPCFSVGTDHVFLRVNRAPMTFKLVDTTMRIDGVLSSRDIPYSWLHHKGASNKTSESDVLQLGHVVTTLPHYLFCKYGLREAFKKFCKVDVIIQHEDDPVDTKEYVVFSSQKVNKPRTLKMKADLYKLIASPMVLLVPRKKQSELVNQFAAAFFYIVDHFPEAREVEDLMGDELWKVWLGYVLFGDQLGRHKLVENVENHLVRGIDEYVDHDCRQMLYDEENLIINDIYELFIYLINNIKGMIQNSEKDIASMFGKRLTVAPYVLRDITSQVMRCLFEITNNRKKVLKFDDYNKILGKFFRHTEVFNLRKTNEKRFMSSVSTPGDNLLFKLTTKIVKQAHTSGSKKAPSVNVNDPSSWLHYSSLEAGNYGMLPKHGPLANNTISPTVKLDENNTIVEKEHLKATNAYVNYVIRR